MDGNSGPISTSDIEPGDNHRADVESDIDSMIRNRKLVVQVTFRSKKAGHSLNSAPVIPVQLPP